MIEPLDQQPAHSAQESEQTALAAAISVHYIVMALYILGTLGGLRMLLASILSQAGIPLGEIVIALLAPLLFALHLLAVRGLQRRSAWGYKASRGLAFLLLLLFPFGTVLGAILLSQLAKFRFST